MPRKIKPSDYQKDIDAEKMTLEQAQKLAAANFAQWIKMMTLKKETGDTLLRFVSRLSDTDLQRRSQGALEKLAKALDSEPVE